MNDLFLGIDIGTSGTKSLVMDKSGGVVASAAVLYDYDTPQNGWTEQHPDLWWDATVKTVGEVCRKVGAKNIKGVGFSGQMHGLVMLDEHDRVIRPALLWNDQRTGDEVEEIKNIIGEQRLIELIANPIPTGFTAPKILWVRNHEPENYKKCAKIMLPKDYIRYKLTGVHGSDVSDASGMGLLDVASRTWCDEVISKLGIDKNLLGRLFESADPAGEVTPEAAKATGLAAGTTVAAGAGDNAASAVGTGVCRDGQAFVSLGTSGVLFAHTSKMILDPGGRVHSFCAAVPGEWHAMGVTLAATASLNWLRENLLTEYKDDSKLGELNRAAEASPVGANRLLYLPYLNGERTPYSDPAARGAFVGLSSSHVSGDLIRAVLEGVVYSLKDCQDIISDMGLGLSKVTACGGGSKSGFWRSMLTDAFGCELNTVQTSDSGALGAAMLAAVAAGAFGSVADVCDAVVKPNASIFPDAAKTGEYHKFHDIYKSLYAALKPGFDALAKTGE